MTTLLAFPDDSGPGSPPTTTSTTTTSTTTTSGPLSRDRSASPAGRQAPRRRPDRTSAQGPGVDRTAPLTVVPVESAAQRARQGWGLEEYRRGLGWPVDEGADGVVLRLGEQLAAVEFPAGRGRDVLALLRARRTRGPVLALPGRQLRWVFLATPDHAGDGTGPVPLPGARVRSAGTLALPPATTPHGPVRWILAPPGEPVPRVSVVVAAGWQTVTVR